MNFFKWLEDVLHFHNECKKMSLRMAKINKFLAVPYTKTNNIEELDPELKSRVQSFWAKYVPVKIDTLYYSIVKSMVYGDDKQSCYDNLHLYISSPIMLCAVIKKLNPPSACAMMDNKGLYAFIFKGFNRAKDIVNCINGIYQNSDGCRISFDEAIEIIQCHPVNLLIKASIDTLGGRSIRLIQDKSSTTVASIIADYGKNFVVQEVVRQSQQTASFNPNSLNTFRISTLLHKGVCHVVSRGFRHGVNGAIVDNADRGGRYIGVKEDGKLKFSIGTNGKKEYVAPDGRIYSDIKIEHFQRVLDFAVALHYRMPVITFAGWDIALDENDMPILIECNAGKAGVTIEQLADEKPIFGEYTIEVLNHAFGK